MNWSKVYASSRVEWRVEGVIGGPPRSVDLWCWMRCPWSDRRCLTHCLATRSTRATKITRPNPSVSLVPSPRWDVARSGEATSSTLVYTCWWRLTRPLKTLFDLRFQININSLFLLFSEFILSYYHNWIIFKCMCWFSS